MRRRPICRGVPAPLGDATQTPADYVLQVSATTGLPHVMVRRNMHKIRTVLAEMEAVVNGLTRRLDLGVLDRGHAEGLSYFPRGESLGVVLPSNSPGVHSLWAPAFALKTPLVLKPGAAEPWTPYRMIQALIQAGAPADVLDTTRRITRARPRSCGAAGVGWYSATYLRRGRGRAIRA